MLDSGLDVFAIGAIMAMAAVAQTMVTGRQAAKRQKDDWARQDDVAKRADERADIVADRLLEANKQTARVAAKSSSELITRVDEVHTLVNDRLTKALNGSLLALEGQLAVLLEIIDPPESTLRHIDNVKQQIAALREELQDRSVQQKQVDAKRAEGGGSST